MNHCTICGSYFDQPVIHTYTDKQVDDAYVAIEELCPVCGRGSQYFEPAKACPVCHRYMPDNCSGTIICADCRASLLRRLNTFAGELREEEEDQLDEWLDGRSIKERSEFR